MLNIVMPMAGRGKRFAEKGFKLPKPLIPIHGTPMTQVVIENLRPRSPHQFIFVVLAEHVAEFRIDSHLKTWVPDCKIIQIDKVTEGAACTVLLAKKWIDDDNPLMLANCDQWVDVDINEYLAAMKDRDADGMIMTMWANDPKWSFCRFDAKGAITEVVEKQVVSNEATVGIYNFRHGRQFVEAAERMIARNARINNEFYVAPVYNEMIAKGDRITYFNVGRELCGMYGLGIPSDLEIFQSLPVSWKAVNF